MSAIQQVMAAGGLYGTTLISALTTASLTTNLKLCLDAGDSASYDPAVQTDKWLDRAGSGYDFFRGDVTGVDARDPTFTGVAGSLQSYWAFDGGDQFTYDTGNEVWMDSLHKNNAILSVVTFFYHSVASSLSIAMSSHADGANTGFRYGTDAGGNQHINVRSSAGATLNVTADTQCPVGYHMFGLSLNEATGAGGAFFYRDGGYDQVAAADTFNSTYTSPAATGSTLTMSVGGSAGARTANGNRLNALAVWQGTALTKANMDTIWAAMRGRFGI